MMSLVKYVCSKCGSDNVTRDASARWDQNKQDWCLVGVHDNIVCEECWTDTKVDEVEIEGKLINNKPDILITLNSNILDDDKEIDLIHLNERMKVYCNDPNSIGRVVIYATDSLDTILTTLPNTAVTKIAGTSSEWTIEAFNTGHDLKAFLNKFIENNS